MSPGPRIQLQAVNYRLIGKILAALLSSPRTAISVADDLADYTSEVPIAPPPGLILTNLVWMFHMGVVEFIATTSTAERIHSQGLWDVMWGPTVHALKHKQFHARCWACRVREQYLARLEALTR